MENKHAQIKRFCSADRDDVRQKEIKQLIFTIEHLMQYVRTVEIMNHLSGLTSVKLRDVYIRLRYYRDRKNYKSDSEFFRKLAEEFYVGMVTIQKVVFDESVLTAYYLREKS